MYRFHFEPGQEAIYALLRSLGLLAEHTYFFHTAYAVYLLLENPERICCVTKWLYPEVARHYGTTPSAVERNIRFALSQVWAREPRLLAHMAGYPLLKRPTTRRFLAILARYLSENRAA